MRTVEDLKELAYMCAIEAGFTLIDSGAGNGRSDVFLTVCKDGENLCDLYMSIDSPGFFFGHSITIKSDKVDQELLRIARICSNYWVVMSVQERLHTQATLILEIRVYENGFNSKVFSLAVNDLISCLEAV